MDNKQTQHRQHFNLSESAKQMLEELTSRRYPGKQRRQSQLVEDLISEAFIKERSMDTATTGIPNPESGKFAPATIEAMNLARQEASRMNANAIYPEHLLLGVIAQGENMAARTLCFCGMDMPAIRVRASEVFSSHYTVDVTTGSEPLSYAQFSQECIEQAITLATISRSPLVQPEHLVLRVLHHKQMSSFVKPFVTSFNELIPRLTEGMGPARELYERWEKQRSLFVPGKVLVRLDYPFSLSSFSDIEGFDEAKQKLQKVIEFFQYPQGSLPVGLLRGVLLVGPRGHDRDALVIATAAEAKVRLAYLSISALAEMLSDIHQGWKVQFTAPELKAFKQGGISRFVHYLFEQVKRTPHLLWIEDLDAVARFAVEEERHLLLNQLLVELDGIEAGRRVAVIATAEHPEVLDPALFLSGRINHRVEMFYPSSHMSSRVAESRINYQPSPTSNQAHLCRSCRREVQPYWKHCTYCGVSLSLTCPNCGTPRAEVEGARFCFECGSPLE